jgi:hypothetical protein
VRNLQRLWSGPQRPGRSQSVLIHRPVLQVSERDLPQRCRVEPVHRARADRSADVASVSPDGHEEDRRNLGVLHHDPSPLRRKSEYVKSVDIPYVPTIQNGCEMRAFIAAWASMLSYDPSWFPDDPNFKESALTLISFDPASEVLKAGGVKPLKLPARSPNLNAFAERRVRSIKEECLSKLILFGESSLRRAITAFTEHYHRERNHQGRGNVLLFPAAEQRVGSRDGKVRCKERLGGLLKYYHREAA